MRIGYVLDRFPSVHQTFVLNEMLALEARRVELVVFSLLPGAGLVHDEVARLRAPVVYAPPINTLGDQLRAHVDAMVHRPLDWLRTLATVVRTPRRVVAANWLRGVSLTPVARSLGITHFHAHFAAGANVAAYTLARVTGRSFSFTMHAVDLYARPVSLHETLSAARFGVTSTQYNLAFLRRKVGADLAGKVALVHACVDPAVFAAVTPVAHDVPTVLSVGRLIEKKGLRYLVEAFGLLNARGIAFRGIIVGDGPERPALEAAIARHELGELVTLAGSVTQAELRRLYTLTDIMALPSVVAADGDQDGIPVSLIEALAVGLPVVSTTVSGIPELVSHDVGILVPPRDPAALAGALEALLGDPEHRARLGSKGPARIRESFDVARSAEQMEALFAGGMPAPEPAKG